MEAGSTHLITVLKTIFRNVPFGWNLDMLAEDEDMHHKLVRGLMSMRSVMVSDTTGQIWSWWGVHRVSSPLCAVSNGDRVLWCHTVMSKVQGRTISTIARMSLLFSISRVGWPQCSSLPNEDTPTAQRTAKADRKRDQYTDRVKPKKHSTVQHSHLLPAFRTHPLQQAGDSRLCPDRGRQVTETGGQGPSMARTWRWSAQSKAWKETMRGDLWTAESTVS